MVRLDLYPEFIKLKQNVLPCQGVNCISPIVPIIHFITEKRDKAQHYWVYFQTEMRHSTRLSSSQFYCLSSPLSSLLLLPSFHLAFFVNSLFCAAMSRLTTCIQTSEKGKKSIWWQDRFTFPDKNICLLLSHAHATVIIASVPTFFVKGQYKLFWDGANRKILSLLISLIKNIFRDLKSKSYLESFK